MHTAILTAFLCLVWIHPARNDKIAYDALVPGSATAGKTQYTGDATYYGQQGNQDGKGACSYGADVSNTMNLEWTSGIQNSIALNTEQFEGGLACGLCIYYRGTGQGIGTTPVPADWQFAFVNNICPECSSGDIDLNLNGDGRWKAEWFPAPCQVKNGTFKYVSVGDLSNPYWFQFSVSNTRVPVRSVDMSMNGNWVPMRRTSNNLYAANGGPFSYWPLPLRITSILGDVVYDSLASKSGGQGQAQFPDRGPATYPGQTSSAQAPALPPAQQAPPPQSTPPQASAPQAPPPQLPPPQNPPASTPSAGSNSSTANSPNPAQALNPASFTVPNFGQCGGQDFYCKDLENAQCKDAIWDLSLCNSGFSCQRTNASWWTCQPGISAAVPATASTSGSIANATQAYGTYQVADGGQCGGNSYFCGTPTNCIDGQWPGSSCGAGRACLRANVSWWGCETPQSAPTPQSSPLAQPPAPLASGGAAVSSAITRGSGGYIVPAEGQCGGDTSYCKDLTNDQCKDAMWDAAQCPTGYQCTRINHGWWQCKSDGSGSATTQAQAPSVPNLQASAFLESAAGRKLI